MNEADIKAMSTEIARLRKEVASLGSQNIVLAGQIEAAEEEITELKAQLQFAQEKAA